MADRHGMDRIGSVSPRRGFITCPHCQANMIIRGSEQESETVKRLRVICTNEDCGLTGIAQLSWLYQLSPSQVPNPEVVIPDCPFDYVRRHYRDSRGPPIDPDQLLMFEDVGTRPG